MNPRGDRLKDYYLDELAALRDEAAEFAREYPDQAQALGFRSGRSRDPQVELLMQSFAFLTGRLRHQLEVDQAMLPNTLLADLYPHLVAPLPSMLVAQLAVKADGANFAKGAVLGRDRQFLADMRDEDGRLQTCRFRSTQETPLWPLDVLEVAMLPADAFDLGDDADTRSVLRVRLRNQGREALHALNIRQLRFFLHSDDGAAWRLQHVLAANLNDVAVRETLAGPLQRLGEGSLRWLGFDAAEAALPGQLKAHPAYRIVQEYFAFPEKFLFFELDAVPLRQANEQVDILFLLDLPLDGKLVPRADVLRVNCVPLVNLYPQRMDPLKLDHKHYEYRMTGDITNHRACEIYKLERLYSIRPDGSPRSIAPYFAMDAFHRLESQDYYYLSRFQASNAVRTGGTEHYVSFLDKQFDLTCPVDEVVGGQALCTNRRLPEQLRVGEAMRLEGAAPLESVSIVTRPTSHHTPALIGDRPWMLASQLALNHLSLFGEDESLTALKDLLRLYVMPGNISGLRQVDGIYSVTAKHMVRWVSEGGKRGYIPGVLLELTLDDRQFEEASAVLFAAVLRHFFALYTNVGTVIQLRLKLLNIKGIVKEWPPLNGSQPLL